MAKLKLIEADPNLGRNSEWSRSYEILEKYDYVEGYGDGPLVLVHLSSGLSEGDAALLKELGWNIRHEVKLYKMIEYW